MKICHFNNLRYTRTVSTECARTTFYAPTTFETQILSNRYWEMLAHESGSSVWKHTYKIILKMIKIKYFIRDKKFTTAKKSLINEIDEKLIKVECNKEIRYVDAASLVD